MKWRGLLLKVLHERMLKKMESRKCYSQRQSDSFGATMVMCLILQLFAACSTAERKGLGNFALADLAGQYRSARTDRERYLIMKEVAAEVRSMRDSSASICRSEFIQAFGRPDREKPRRIQYDYLIDSARLLSVLIGFDADGKSTGALPFPDDWGSVATDISEVEDRDTWMKLFGENYYVVIGTIWIDPFKLEEATLSQVCSFIMGKVNPRLESIGCKGVDISVKNDDGRKFRFESRGGCIQSVIKEIELFMGCSVTNNFDELKHRPEMSPSIVFDNCRRVLHFNESD